MLYLLTGCDTSNNIRIAIVENKTCYLLIDSKNKIIPIDNSLSKYYCMYCVDSMSFSEDGNKIKICFFSTEKVYFNQFDKLSYSQSDTSDNIVFVFKNKNKLYKPEPPFFTYAQFLVAGKSDSDTIYIGKESNYTYTISKRNYSKIGILPCLPLRVDTDFFPLYGRDTIYIHLFDTLEIDYAPIFYSIIFNKDSVPSLKDVNGVDWYFL